MRAVREYGKKILNCQWLHTQVSALGLDETAFLGKQGLSGGNSRHVDQHSCG